MTADNLLERAFMARIRADEIREELAALQGEFDEREDVIALKRKIERCEEERRQCIAQAKAAAKQDAVPATPPSAEEQAAEAVARVVKPPAPAETPAAEDVCEKCGAPVPKSQAILSQLFMSKTLCKQCMEAP